jgi:hypothetical protein
VDAASGPDAAHRGWYAWADPGPGGRPPHNWLDATWHPAWQLDEPSGQCYLHSFLTSQPDLNWLPYGNNAARNVAAQRDDPGSVLHLCRAVRVVCGPRAALLRRAGSHLFRIAVPVVLENPRGEVLPRPLLWIRSSSPANRVPTGLQPCAQRLRG